MDKFRLQDTANTPRKCKCSVSLCLLIITGIPSISPFILARYMIVIHYIHISTMFVQILIHCTYILLTISLVLIIFSLLYDGGGFKIFGNYVFRVNDLKWLLRCVVCCS